MHNIRSSPARFSIRRTVRGRQCPTKRIAAQVLAAAAHRLRAPDVQKLVAERTGRTEFRIQVRNTHTYLIVPEADVPQVIAALHGHKFGERELVCEPAKRS